jgi:DNA-binding LacI/PurR family transcriptional regulator
MSGKDDLPIEIHIADNKFAPAGWAVPQEQPSYEATAYQEAQHVLARGICGHGIIAANDQTAYGFMKAAEDYGLRSGRDYAIVAFDDRPASRYCELTSARPPWSEIGNEAARLLLDAVENGTENSVVDGLRAQIIPRSSSILAGA